MMILFGLTYKTYPVLSLIIFAVIGFTTMLAQPVTLVWAQRTLPEYKSTASGFINGFCWGIVALIISVLGAISENFGIMNVLIILSILPVLSCYFVKYLNEIRE